MLKNTFTTKKIVLMGLLVALSAALAPLVIMITPQQKFLSLYFIPLAVGAVTLGPVAALLMGFAADTINFLLPPAAGLYFPGYALSLMLSCLIYALWQYNKPVRLWRVVCAQLCNAVFINFGLNHLWRVIQFGAAPAAFYSSTRLISNAIQLPLLALAVYGLSKTALTLMKRHEV